MAVTTMAKRTVTFDGKTYKVRSDKIDIPDLDQLSRFAALQWLIQHTYPRGYSRPQNPLAGYGGTIATIPARRSARPEGGPRD
jgi:hypothetical protein